MAAYLGTIGLLLVAFCAAETFALKRSKTLEHRVADLERTCLRLPHAVEAMKAWAGAVTNESVTVTGCPDRFDRVYNGYCYFFSDNLVTWDVAKFECSELDEDAYLAEIMNSDEAYFLRGEAERSGGGDRWIGLEDIDGSFTWVWYASHTYIHAGDYTDWAVGEPNYKGQEKCAHLSKAYSFQWNNIQCGIKMQYICKTKRA